ncbi:MAG: hypothetical protein Q8L87_18205 [Anaerolineales bacterium]|jgi:hypothetical protein|nr:hypothetical protein [Anaerolineales bacterium]
MVAIQTQLFEAKDTRFDPIDLRKDYGADAMKLMLRDGIEQ